MGACHRAGVANSGSRAQGAMAEWSPNVVHNSGIIHRPGGVSTVCSDEMVIRTVSHAQQPRAMLRLTQIEAEVHNLL
jgi:hypothetical protein